MELGWDHGPEEPRDKPAGLDVAQPRDVDPVDVVQAARERRVALEQLRTSRRDDEQWDPLRPVRKVFEKREHGVVGPMDVLEDEDRRMGLGDLLQEGPPRREELVAFGGRADVDADERSKALAKPVAIGPRRHRVIDLGARNSRIVRLEDARLGLHDLAERPERNAVTVWQAATLAPRQTGLAGLRVGEELGDDPGLPDARLADDGHELNRVRGHALVEQALEQGQVDLAADVGTVVGPGEVDAEAGARGGRLEDPNGLGLAFQDRRRELQVLEDGLRCRVCCEANRHAHLGSHRLDAGRGVDRVAGEEALA